MVPHGHEFYPPQAFVYKRQMIEQDGTAQMMHNRVNHRMSNMHAVKGMSPYPCQGPCCYPDFQSTPPPHMMTYQMNYMPSQMPGQSNNLGRLITQGLHQSQQSAGMSGMRRRDAKHYQK